MVLNLSNRVDMQGQLFACTDKTKHECFRRLLFGTNRAYAPAAMRVRKGHYLFLLDLDSDLLYGVFRATSDAKMNIQPSAWKGKYPYQVEVGPLGEITPIKSAKKLLKKLGIPRSSPINRKALVKLLELYRSENSSMDEWFKFLSRESGAANLEISEESKSWELLSDLKQLDAKPEEELPLLEATTLWDFPRQSYGITPKGDNKYPGVTPALLIWNLNS